MSDTTGGDTVSGWAFAVRQRRGAMMQRVAVGLASSLAATPLVGWPIALTWGAAYMAIQVWEAFVFGPVNASPSCPMSRARHVLGGATMFANTGLYGALSLLLWVFGGPAGGVSAAIMLPAAMVYSMVNAPRSLTVLACTVTPQILYMTAFPLLLMQMGAPPATAVTAAAAVTIFVIYCLSVWRGLAERARREQKDRLLAEDHAARLRKALDEQGAFLAAIGHDLRTPIGAILSGAAELRGGDLQVRQKAELITDAGQMMKSLLDDLLDHSRIEAGRMKVEVADFDLRALLAQTLRLWRGAVEAKGLRLRIEGAHRIPAGVRGDAMRLRQVLNNLMSNAVKFTAQGDVTLRLNAWSEEPSGYALLIEVADTGPGMTSDQLGRLFKPFDQTADGVGAAHGGSGLGLSISRNLIELMGGRLTARSAPGQGARFTVSLFLPRADAVATATAPTLDDSRLAVARVLAERRAPEAGSARPAPVRTAPIAPAPAPAPAPARVEPEPPLAAQADDEDRPLRLLVVDDHDINRRAVQLILQPLGCDIVAAADGLAALDRCRETVFDVIFMDVRMPELDGRETTRRLRAEGGPNAATPVVAVTADTAPEDIAACQAAGMAYFVPKPLTPPALLGALQHVLEETQGGEAQADGDQAAA
ncbi:MAG: hybrid sensor histidine kinase/response regulator [Brevundimonas sp.]|uniref:histidine kinase n=1 Tax=Brevundimonas albigilva TaxID=1312364 RepID=A0ABY4SLU9_9CAUL|nr:MULTISPECIES: ATP-binding protein [Brevundimonas]PZU56803.1 MAG: hybrid sensor histidine kinase/response regulator [Brevundimonas sp.]URI14542.1 ATP-binding protein [Brevundimonas albigilva]